MSNKKNTAPKSGEKFKSKIGGQALIEGIMMLGPDKGAMACRMPDGSIDLETAKTRRGTKKLPLCAAVSTSSCRSSRAISI